MSPKDRSAAANDSGTSFRLLRCHVGCFHLVWASALEVHFTPAQLRTAVESLESLLNERSQPVPAEQASSVCHGYWCAQGHCHLICHNNLILRLSETAARRLRDAMAAACERLDDGNAVGATSAYVM